MAVTIITGRPGSGKSYECVKNHILPGLAAGRRVVTNVQGLDHALIAEHLGLPLADIQQRLIVVPSSAFLPPSAYPPPDSSLADPSAPPSLIQPGDLVVMDEFGTQLQVAWQLLRKDKQHSKYFVQGIKVPAYFIAFLSIQRHLVANGGEAVGVSTTVVIVNQTSRGIDANVTGVAEIHFHCRKHLELGRPQSYKLTIMSEGADERATQHNYDTAIFPLYNSYDKALGVQAVEVVDKRQRVIKPIHLVGFGVAVLFLIGCSWSTYRFFHPATPPLPASVLASSSAASAPPSSIPATPSASSFLPSSSRSSATAIPAGYQSDWRIAARYTSGSLQVFVLQDNAGHFRTITAASYSAGAGADVSVQLQNGLATPWTTSAPTTTK